MLPKKSFLPLCIKDTLPPKFEKIKNGKYTRKDLDFPINLYLQDNDITVQENGSEIVKFLRGKCILLTGATGFLGKLLLEKLLRSCEDLKVIVIVREKKGKGISTRMNEMLDTCVFYRLSKIHPNFRQNVIVIPGDLSMSQLGLSLEHRQMLIEKVNIIYHAAATVRFDEPLKKAVNCNVLGFVEVLKLAKECKNLEVFTHISTAYSNCDRKLITEDFYTPTLTVEQLRFLTDTFDDDLLNRITPGLLGNLPNVYTLTKQSIEDYIKREALGIPACICRPSIVLATAREPFFAWSDNIMGPSGFLAATGCGLVHIQKGKLSNKCDIIPADLVVNHCIAASFRTTKERNLQDIPIYNCVSSCQNPHTWQFIYDTTTESIPKIGSFASLSHPFYINTMNEFLYKLGSFLFHDIPACIVDFGLVCSGKKPMLRDGYKKLGKFASVLAFFTSNEFEFDDTKTVSLWDSLNEIDKKNYNFDVASVDWFTYYTRFVLCVKENILKEPIDETLEETRKRAKRLYYALLFFPFFFISLLILLVVFLLKCFSLFR